MIDAPLPIAAGFLSGLLFFAGLWWTVRHLSDFGRPALIVFGSALLRTGAVLGAFYWAAGGEWTRLLFCLLGFLLARVVVTWSTRSSSSLPSGEAGRAP